MIIDQKQEVFRKTIVSNVRFRIIMLLLGAKVVEIQYLAKRERLGQTVMETNNDISFWCIKLEGDFKLRLPCKFNAQTVLENMTTWPHLSYIFQSFSFFT